MSLPHGNDAALRERARLRYRPERVQLLFIAEAPPSALDRFFYFESVTSHDWLFLALIRQLYPDARTVKVSEIRARKAALLSEFARDGYYLIDSLDVPLTTPCSISERSRRIAENLPNLKRKVAALASTTTPLVLISHSVFRACHEPLRVQGFRVLNSRPLDFPAMGHQKKFATELARLLASAGYGSGS